MRHIRDIIRHVDAYLQNAAGMDIECVNLPPSWYNQLAKFTYFDDGSEALKWEAMDEGGRHKRLLFRGVHLIPDISVRPGMVVIKLAEPQEETSCQDVDERIRQMIRDEVQKAVSDPEMLRKIWEGNQKQAAERGTFEQFLHDNAKRVSEWPDWKKHVLGRTKYVPCESTLERVREAMQPQPEEKLTDLEQFIMDSIDRADMFPESATHPFPRSRPPASALIEGILDHDLSATLRAFKNPPIA